MFHIKKEMVRLEKLLFKTEILFNDKNLFG